MFAVIEANDTAPSSMAPICPTANIEATVREYCSINVTTKGLEYLQSVLASLCHVVLILTRCDSGFPLLVESFMMHSR